MGATRFVFVGTAAKDASVECTPKTTTPKLRDWCQPWVFGTCSQETCHQLVGKVSLSKHILLDDLVGLLEMQPFES